jgi:3-hydroxyisobutyrate dehydrogenase-like beta-hydroxyacid dehydrogenase
MSEGVGFIGLGNMGQPMAGRLLEAGFSLTVCDLVKARTDDLAKRGAKAVGTPKEVAAQSDVTISMIPDGPALKKVAFGDNGVLAGTKPGSIFIDMSTVDPESSVKVAKAAGKRGVKMLRAPISGSTVLAKEGKLTIFASGDKETYDKCQKIFSTMGQKTFYVGAEDEARYLKLVLNMMVGTTCQMLAEALTFGEKAGLDWNQMLEIIEGSVVASPLVSYKIVPLAKRNFTPAFTASMMAKDFDLALAAGQKLGAPMPTTSLVRQFLGMLETTGRGELDFSALLLLMEELGGAKPRNL